MTRKLIVSVVLMFGVLAGGAGGLWFMLAHKVVPASRNPQRRPIVVRTARLARSTVRDELVGYGTARALRQATVAAQVTGQVIERAAEAKVGQAVAKDQILFRIDAREYEQLLCQAEQMLQQDQSDLDRLGLEEQNLQRLRSLAETDQQLAQTDLKRIEELFGQKQAAQTELINARLQVQRYRTALEQLASRQRLLPVQRRRTRAQQGQHEAAVKIAELNVERCTLRAPFDGRISAANADVGDLVTPGQAIFSVIDPEVVEVAIELAASDRPRVAVGHHVRLLPAGNDSAGWEGQVSRIGPEADERDRTCAVYVEVDNRQTATPLVPGTFLKAALWGRQLRNVILLPRQALLAGKVFVLSGGRAHERRPQLGRVLPMHVVVTSGLEPGQEVILTNLDALADGTSVRSIREPLASHMQDQIGP